MSTGRFCGTARRSRWWTPGIPRYGAAVRDSIRQAGLDLAGLEAIVVTHAHIDHIGGVQALRAARQCPSTWALPSCRWPSVTARSLPDRWMSPSDCGSRELIPWSLRITAAGGAGHATVPDAIGVADGAVLDIPGRPTVVLTPGHTSGHICLRSGGALLTGDALITGHAITGRKGPQLAAGFFHTNAEQAAAALDRIACCRCGRDRSRPRPGVAWHGS